MDPILASLRNTAKEEILELKRRLKKASSARALLGRVRNPRKLTYEVWLESLWKREGEQDLIYTATGELSKVILAAEDAFMKKNNRTDVQAIYTVSIILDDKHSILLEENVWKSFCQKNRVS